MKILIGCVLVLVSVMAIAYDGDVQEKELIALDARFQAAVKAHDAKAVGDFLLDDYVLIGSSSRMLTKSGLLQELATPGFKYEDNTSDQVRARVHGNVAVVTARLHQAYMYSGKHYDNYVLYTDTWIKTDSGWKQLSGHATSYKPPVN